MSGPMDDIVFVGDWVKERTLGSGSFGIVVLWRHRHSNERLAIKTCRWGDELTAKHRERWTKEVEMLRTCNNENIVTTIDLPPEFVAGLEQANPSKLPILCMEYCSGGDLRQLLNRVEFSSGLKEFQIRSILTDLKNAMEFLHKNKITHRDLKPENVVMKLSGPEDGFNQSKVTYKLIDLGYAKEIDQNSVCASFVGTLQYLAPELFYSKTYSNSVDFWSFGLLAFEIVCGVRPFLPHMAPVQWMPLVKTKSAEHICVYETYHGDVEYSSEIFPENHITKAFKLLVEKWLKVALEFDPKLRGRDGSKAIKFNLPNEGDTQENKFGNVVIFSLLQEVLSKKIIKIFSAFSLEILAYEIDDSVVVSRLKKWIERDTKVAADNQILLVPRTYINIADTEFVVKYWNDGSGYILYVYHKEYFMKDNLQPKLPKAIQRCLEQPKAFYNFKNSRDLYKSGLYFIQTEKDSYDSLIKSCLIKAESLKMVGKELFLKHNDVDKAIGRLRTVQEILFKTLTTSKRHVRQLQEKFLNGAIYLESFEKIFTEAHDAVDKFTVLEMAWNSVTTRLKSATRRSNEVNPGELLNGFVSKYNFQSLLSDMLKVYMNYKLNDKDFRILEKQCQDVVKISYNCLKIRDKILQDIRTQPFILKLLDISLEFTKISSTIDTASESTDKLLSEMTNTIDDLVKSTWQTVDSLASAANDNLELPYSVVSFERSNFKIGASASNRQCETDNNPLNCCSMKDGELNSLIEDSLQIRQLQNQLTDQLNKHKQDIMDGDYDFSFLDK